VRYYLEKRDPEFEPKMAEILCIYRQVAVLREQGQGAASAAEGTQGSQAIISYDEKPGIQAIGTTAPDRPPLPGTSPTVMRDHEYKRHGTLTLIAGIDLLTGHVHALVRERHRSREFIEFLKLLNAAYPADTAIELILDNHSAHVSRETNELACRAADRAFYLHVHADPRVMAQSHRGLLLKAGAFGPAPHPRPLQTRTQGTPDGLHCRHQ
jgi:transposase